MNRVTHGDRVVDPTARLTKLDLVRCYGLVAAAARGRGAGRELLDRLGLQRG